MLLNTKGTGINFINKERISGYLCMVTSSHGCNIHTLYMDYWQGLHIKQRSCLLSEKDFSDCVICIWRLSMYGAFALEYARANFYLRCQTFQVNLAMLNNLAMPGPQVTPSWVKQERAWLTVLKKSVGSQGLSRYNFNPVTTRFLNSLVNSSAETLAAYITFSLLSVTLFSYEWFEMWACNIADWWSLKKARYQV